MTQTLEVPRQKNDTASTIDVTPNVVVQQSGNSAKRRRQRVVIGIFVLLLATTAGIGWQSRSSELSKRLGSSRIDSKAIAFRTPVRIFVVEGPNARSDLQSFTGTVKPRHETPLAFRVGGKILKRHVEVGQEVTAEQLLFELEAEDYELQVETALAALEVARASVQRSTADEKRLAELLRSSAISPSEYERALAERDIALGQRQSAERQLQLANNQLSYCKLKADFAGVVTTIDAESGQVVSPGTKLATLAQWSELEAVIDIPENRLPQAHERETQVYFWSLPNIAVTGILREISPVADAATRTFRARFTLQHPPEQVKLGMTARVELTNSKDENTFRIPLSSIITRRDVPHVWLLDATESHIQARTIRIVKYEDDSALVTEGLAAGDKIVSAGVQKLDESLEVRVWEIQP